MHSSDLIRLSGLAAVLGAALLIISDFLSFTVFSGDLMELAATGAYLADGAARVLAGILLLIGLVGLYVRQSEASGIPGLIAFLVAFAGTALILGTWWTNAFVAPSLATDAPAFLEAGPTGVLGFAFTMSFALAALGWLLFGVVSLRAKVYPRVAAAALVVGAALTFAPLPATGVVFYAAIAWLGVILFSRKELNPAKRPVH
ncbi:MAG: hypothetical protein ACRDSJ_11090 [Rubrobacteraceae bacterium]